MKKEILILIFLIFASMFLPSSVAKAQDIYINEFTTGRTVQVELFNNSSKLKDISSWYLDDSGGSSFFEISDGTVVYPHSCLVIEAELFLNTKSEDTIRLFDNTAPPTSSSARLVDSYTYDQSLSEGKSFSRFPDRKSWKVGGMSFGKYNESGNNCQILPTPTLALTPTFTSSPTPSPTSMGGTSTPTLTPTPTLTVVDGVIINEFMPAPVNGNEWVELYNENDREVQLSDWYIDDIKDGGSTPFKFSLTLPPHSFSRVTLTKSMLNNSGDTVRLLDPNKKEKDAFSFKDSRKGISWGRESVNSDKFCLQQPSPDKENNGCLRTSDNAVVGKLKEETVGGEDNESNNMSHKKDDYLSSKNELVKFTNQNYNLDDSYLKLGETSFLGSTDILGARTHNDVSSHFFYLNKMLVFLSFSYSSLTIIVLLRKIYS